MYIHIYMYIHILLSNKSCSYLEAEDHKKITQTINFGFIF